MSNVIEIYQADEGVIEVHLDSACDTVWLSRVQLVALFRRVPIGDFTAFAQRV